MKQCSSLLLNIGGGPRAPGAGKVSKTWKKVNCLTSWY